MKKKASKKKVAQKAAARATYKHREILEFKGVSYRYDKPYGEWRLIEPKKADYFVPKTIWEKGDGVWEVNSVHGATPVEALETWFAGLIELRTREAAEAKQHAVELKAEVRRLKMSSWDTREV